MEAEKATNGKMDWKTAAQRVTYAWQGVEVDVNVTEGSCFKKVKHQKRILDSGKVFLLKFLFNFSMNIS
jgi:hypothetical protein